jgi:hypothetical protein
MNKFNLAILLAVIVSGFSSNFSLAGYQGSISFTDDEIARHEQDAPKIATEAAQCLSRDFQHFQDFFRRYGVSPYYGDRGSFGKLSYEQKKQYLEQIGKNPALLPEMEPLSCVELMLNCLGEGFNSNGEADLWKRIRDYTILNGVDGMATQNALQKLGWKILYWNPDVRYNHSWDAQERRQDPSNNDRFWGYHEENWQDVQRAGKYIYNTVDDDRLLVNFGYFTPAILKKVPFFVGIAHGGYHVFPGMSGKVVEAHSTKAITDSHNMESSPFNPMLGQGPTDGMYKSGLIAIPPGYLDNPTMSATPPPPSPAVPAPPRVSPPPPPGYNPGYPQPWQPQWPWSPHW